MIALDDPYDNKISAEHNNNRYQTRLDKANAAVGALKQEIAALQQQVSAADKSQASATQIRAEEKADNAKAAKDFKESAEAVTRAIEVLREYYGANAGQVSFLQQPEFGEESADAAHGIIAILETSQSDFSRLLAETETSESEAQAAYETLSQENKVYTPEASSLDWPLRMVWQCALYSI